MKRGDLILLAVAMQHAPGYGADREQCRAQAPARLRVRVTRDGRRRETCYARRP